MGWLSIDILCPQCDNRWDDIIDREVDSYLLTFDCPRCGEEECRRTMSAPNVTRASYPDGYKRGSAFEDQKAAARLRADRANLPHDKRGEINTEIRAREKSSAKGSIKKEKGQ